MRECVLGYDYRAKPRGSYSSLQYKPPLNVSLSPNFLHLCISPRLDSLPNYYDMSVVESLVIFNELVGGIMKKQKLSWYTVIAPFPMPSQYETTSVMSYHKPAGSIRLRPPHRPTSTLPRRCRDFCATPPRWLPGRRSSCNLARFLRRYPGNLHLHDLGCPGLKELSLL